MRSNGASAGFKIGPGKGLVDRAVIMDNSGNVSMKKLLVELDSVGKEINRRKILVRQLGR